MDAPSGESSIVGLTAGESTTLGSGKRGHKHRLSLRRVEQSQAMVCGGWGSTALWEPPLPQKPTVQYGAILARWGPQLLMSSNLRSPGGQNGLVLDRRFGKGGWGRAESPIWPNGLPPGCVDTLKRTTQPDPA